MIRKDKVLLGTVSVLIISLIGFGAYTIFVEYPNELAEELLESQRVADSLNDEDVSLTNCDEIRGKQIGLSRENFQGVELIVEAWDKKSIELECKSTSSILWFGEN